MKVEILKDSTITVKAGQIVDVDDCEIARLLKMGRVAIPKEKKAAKKK